MVVVVFRASRVVGRSAQTFCLADMVGFLERSRVPWVSLSVPGILRVSKFKN